MYVKVGDAEYRAISDVEFTPEADLFGETLPVSEFWANVHTEDEIPVGSWAELRDDADNLWARYVVLYSERQGAGIRRVKASSVLFKLDGVTVEAAVYGPNVTFSSLVGQLAQALKGDFGTELFKMPTTLGQRTVSGYFPEQSGRERLLWLCLSVGAYARDYFSDRVWLLPYSHTSADEEAWEGEYPADSAYADSSRVFWKPTINHGEYVTSVDVEYYSYSLTTSGVSRLDEYVDIWKDGIDREQADPSNPQNFDTYVRRKSHVRLSNPDAPSVAMENEVSMREVTCVNGGNVNEIAVRLALYHFNRTEVSLDVIDNGEVLPGMMLTTFADTDKVVVGFVRSASFSFGLQARASLTLTGCTVTDAAPVTIRHMWGEMEVGRKSLHLPVGYPFETDALYSRVRFEDGHDYVLRPETERVSGVAVAGGVTIDVPMHVALEYLDGALYTVSADDVKANDTMFQSGSAVVYE